MSVNFSKKEHLSNVEISPQKNDEVACPSCSSQSYVKRGINKGKQRYRCKKCGRYFNTNSKKISQYPQGFDFNNDLWTAEQIGVKIPAYRTRAGKALNFSPIQQDWLKYLAKKFIYYSASHKAWATLRGNYLSAFYSFSKFLSQINFSKELQDLDRNIIVEYLNFLNQTGLAPITRIHILSSLSLFFETGLVNEWFHLQPHLIRSEDYPKENKVLPRYIPEEVIQQLNKHLGELPEPIQRMVLVLQECGLRIGELCLLSFNCLKNDGKEQYRIQFMRWKMNQETSLPISPELAYIIQEQQKYIRQHLGDKFDYLFCGRKTGGKANQIFIPAAKIISDDCFLAHLKRLAKKCNIKDQSGKLWNFQTHQFRHTVGTRMINNGVPQHIIQRYLGHESPKMTAVYAHIHDQTLRKEIEKYHETRVVNFQGESVELEKTVLSSNDDLEWFKKNVLAMALPHGYCGRPKVLGFCNLPTESCYDCPHWRTNKNFLPVLKDTLLRTNNIINKSRNYGWELQVAKNQPIKNNLEKVIKALEEDGNNK